MKKPQFSCSPKVQTLFSLIAFCIGIGSIAVWLGMKSYMDVQSPWWYFYAAAFLGALLTGLVSRIVFGYKKLHVFKNSVFEKKLFGSREHDFKNIVSWELITVNTSRKSEFRQLEVRFQDEKRISRVTVSESEYTNFPRFLKLLQRRFAKKKVTARS